MPASPPNPSVTVVGATGMIGRAVTHRLVADGHQVTALVRNPAAAAQVLPDAVRLAPGDMEAPDTLREPLSEADAVVIVMPLTVGDRAGFVPERDGTRNVLDAIPAGRDPRVVKLSEIGAGSDPGFFDLEAKARAEESVRASEHPFVIVRPTYVMEGWLWQLRAGPDFLSVGSGRRRIRWVALADLARWMSAAVRDERALGKTLTAQGRDAVTMPDAAERLAQAAGARVVHVPTDGVVPPGAPEGLVQTLRELFRYYDRAPEPLLAQELWDVLGEPQVSFDAFVDAFPEPPATG